MNRKISFLSTNFPKKLKLVHPWYLHQKWKYFQPFDLIRRYFGNVWDVQKSNALSLFHLFHLYLNVKTLLISVNPELRNLL